MAVSCQLTFFLKVSPQSIEFFRYTAYNFPIRRSGYMNHLNFSDNIIRLRHYKKITQEQLADFVGVTKASVSKWETGQSLPDILMLPRLAAFFDVTIDELLGYEPQLSKEQIRKIYRDLAVSFAELPFHQAMQNSEDYVKKYYSCYPFLLQICILWLNHFMLAEEKSAQERVLEKLSDLCGHITANCRNIGICEDATIIMATASLQLGKANQAIEITEEILNPRRLSSQSDSILIQAYLLAGKKESADSFAQMSMFLHLILLIQAAAQYLEIHSDMPDICEATIRRIEGIISSYDLEHLHSSAAQFHYQTAVVYCMHGKKEQALNMLRKYADEVDYLLTGDNFSLHGDKYFYSIQKWFEQLDLGADAPRDKRIIYESFLQSLANPAFSVLKDNKDYQNICRMYAEKGENL